MVERFFPGQPVTLVNLHRHCENSSLLLGRVKNYLSANGYRLQGELKGSGIAVLSTCALTDEMMAANERAIRTFVETSDRTQVVVLGCLGAFPDQLKSLLEAFPDRIVLHALDNHNGLDDLFQHEIPWVSVSQNRLYEFDKYQPHIGPEDTFVMISQGCTNHCSYCNIRKAKGSVKSRTKAEVLAETKSLYASGVRELTLLSDDCGSYGVDIGEDLTTLIDGIVAQKADAKVKIYTIYPAHLLRFQAKLLHHCAAGKITYLCVPVQSGSPEVLASMNRRVDVKALGGAIEQMRSVAPTMFLYTHFIVGFPGESEADFSQTLALARLFSSALFIRYGENANTAAAAFSPKCTSEQVKRRMDRVRAKIDLGELPTSCTVLG